MTPMVRIVLLSFCLWNAGCFVTPFKSNGSVSTPSFELRIGRASYTSETKAVSTYDPSATGPMKMVGPSGSLAGSSITLPAGALSISVDLVVEESVPLSETSVAASLNLRSDLTISPVGAGLIIRPTSDVNLSRPLQIAMPLPSTGLIGTALKTFQLTQSKNYVVFYKYFMNGELRAGVIPASSLTFNDQNQVVFDGFFGAYWLCETNFSVTEKVEVKTVEPLFNSQRVAVIEAAGFVPETVVAAKATIPERKWNYVSLVADLNERSVKLTAEIEGGFKLTECVADLAENMDSVFLQSTNVGATPLFKYSLKDKAAHSIKARFHCLDDQGRSTVSPWSAVVVIPAVSETSTVKAALVAPLFTLAAGTYSPGQLISISSADSTANIYYTIDGNEPDFNSPIYDAAFVIYNSTVVKAFAAKSVLDRSPTSSILYVIQAMAPTFSIASGTYASSQIVSVYNWTPDATVYYTVDGTTPSAKSPIYTTPLTININTTIKAFAVKSGIPDSIVATVMLNFTIAKAATAAPVFSVAPGAYATPQDVAITSATSGAQIFFTTDGSTPFTGSQIYSMPVHLSGSSTLKAIALKSGLSSSSVTSASYSISSTADTTSPAIVALSFNQTTVNTQSGSQQITLTLTISDDYALPTNGENFNLILSAPSGSQSLFFYGYASDADAAGTGTNRTFQITRTFPQGSMGGIWTVSSLNLRDNVGNLSYYTTTNLNDLSLPITVNNLASTWDSILPTITSLGLSATTVDTTSADVNITIAITIADDFALPSNGESVNFSINAPTGSQTLFFYAYGPDADAGGTATSRTFHITRTLPAGSTAGLWSIQGINIRDEIGNTHYYSVADLVSATLPYQFTNAATAFDSVPPNLVSLSISPASVSTTGGDQIITVTLTLSDDFALPAIGENFNFSINAPTGSQTLFFYGYSSDAQVGGTSLNRTFVITRVLPAGSMGGTWTIANLNIRDNLGNSHYYSTSLLMGASFPTSFVNAM